MAEKLLRHKKIILAVLGTLLVILAVLATILPAKFAGYDYAHLLSDREREEGKEVKGTASDVPGMIKVAETHVLELLYNEDTAEVAVKDKRSGKVWHSNPPGREEDGLANQTEKARMSSALIISYYDAAARKYSMLSYADSVQKGQYEASLLEDGIRVTYTMGEVDSAESKIPRYITAQRLEEKITSRLSEKEAKFVTKRYAESTTKEGFLELRKDVLSSPVYLERMLDALEEAGYTREDLDYENEQSGYIHETVKPYVKISIEYVLDNDRMKVTVPLDRMENEESMRISDMEVLSYFGAGSKEEEGYMVVPSGCGALIRFNNGKEKEDSYMQPVYGTDPVLTQRTKMQNMQISRLPVFGMKNGADAFLAIIEAGQSLASVTADVSGRKNGYNSVSSVYSIRTTEEIDMNGLKSTVKTLVEKEGYAGDISVTYAFMPQEKADYTGMANYYQDYLVANGVLTRTDAGEAPEFYLDILGSVQKKEITLGVQHQSVLAMTTYKQAGEILDILESRGISNVQMRYLGWFNRGVSHDIAKDIDLDSAAGSKKELRQLAERLAGQGGGLYPEVNFVLVPKNTDHYSRAYEASRQISGQTILTGPYNPATLTMDTGNGNAVSYVNSPNALPKQMNGFLRDFEKLSIGNLSLGDLGNKLASDKTEKRKVDRECSRLIAEEQMGRLKETADRLMVSGGNAYSLACADLLVDIPAASDRFYILDEEIPFYEMTVRGCLGYTGTAVNLSSTYNEQDAMLRMVEYGLAPHFAFSYKEPAEFENTVLEHYFSTCYEDWMDTAVQFWQAACELQEKVYNARIAEHRIYDNGLRQVSYDNGVTVLVNYSDTDITVHNETIRAKSYKIKG